MSKSITMTMLAVLLALLAGCPARQADTKAAADEHAGHAHPEPAVEAVPGQDEHAGHDHGEADAEAEDSHAGPAGQDDHAGHDEQGGEGNTIRLSEAQVSELGIFTQPASAGVLGRELELSGEIGINEDRITHVYPRVGGIVRNVRHSLGDRVKQGSVLLELDSLELAELGNSYEALLSQLALLSDSMERERKLFEKGISPEQDYLAAKQAHEEKLIEKRGLEQRLRTLGVNDAAIAGLPANGAASISVITVAAPASGEIIEKHASAGELVDASTSLFTIGDMGTLWVRLNIYPQDMADVQQGMDVIIDAGHGIPLVTGTIGYIEPLVGEETRTAVARVVLPRPQELFRPGMFVTGLLEVGGEAAELVVPPDSVVELDEDRMVFVRSAQGFEPRVVTVGRSTASGLEILSGIEPGEDIVISGAFQLKAELLKGSFDPHAGHAH